MDLCYKKTKMLLTELRLYLDRLAHELVQREDMGDEDVGEVLRSLHYDRDRLWDQLVAEVSQTSNVPNTAPPDRAVNQREYGLETGVFTTAQP